MQPSHAPPEAGTGRRWRWAIVVAGVVLLTVISAAAYVASANLADAACSADPPGVAMPEHQGRSLEPRIDGWDCVLRDYVEAESTTVHLGWWPSDPTAPWEQVEQPAG